MAAPRELTVPLTGCDAATPWPEIMSRWLEVDPVKTGSLTGIMLLHPAPNPVRSANTLSWPPNLIGRNVGAGWRIARIAYSYWRSFNAPLTSDQG
jgi:hypothetical protein